MLAYQIQSTLEEWEIINRKIYESLNDAGFSLDFILSFSLAADEVFANISMYAYAPKTGPVNIKLEVHSAETQRCAVLTFEDSGRRFDPLSAPPPDSLDKTLHERPEGGLGIFLIKSRVDKLEYSYCNETNILTLKKSEKG